MVHKGDNTKTGINVFEWNVFEMAALLSMLVWIKCWVQDHRKYPMKMGPNAEDCRYLGQDTEQEVCEHWRLRAPTGMKL